MQYNSYMVYEHTKHYYILFKTTCIYSRSKKNRVGITKSTFSIAGASRVGERGIEECLSTVSTDGQYMGI